VSGLLAEINWSPCIYRACDLYWGCPNFYVLYAVFN